MVSFFNSFLHYFIKKSQPTVLEALDLILTTAKKKELEGEKGVARRKRGREKKRDRGFKETTVTFFY